MDLKERKCVPCEGGTPRLDPAEVARYLGELQGWSESGGRIAKTYTFADFIGAMRFVNRLAGIAEGEGHHPDFCVHWNRVDVTLWTHAIDGLSENDFIVAAKLDQLT